MFISPYTELFSYRLSLANALLLGSASSAVSYMLVMLVSDGGIRFEDTTAANFSLDKEVDAAPGNKLLQG